MLTEAEKHLLLQCARQSIVSAVKDMPPPRVEDCPAELLKPAGAFVTLHEKNDLRGCIGFIDTRKPLINIVQEAAARAAMDDPRFEPVSSGELNGIEIEISVLSPLKRIERIEEIEIGTHGLVVELGNRRGLLLPQVAKEYGWDNVMLFKQTLKKAGLPPTLQLHHDLRMFTFTAEIFREHSSSFAGI